PLLLLQQTQACAIQWRSAPLSPLGPIVGQGWIVGRRRAWDHRMPEIASPGVLVEIGAALAVAIHPTVTSGLVERAKVSGNDPALRFVRVAVGGPFVGEPPHVGIHVDKG